MRSQSGGVTTIAWATPSSYAQSVFWELIRSLQRGGRASTLGRAIGELGRIPKTLHLLNFIADSNYRRHILNQLNRGEGRGRLSRKVFYGSVEPEEVLRGDLRPLRMPEEADEELQIA